MGSLGGHLLPGSFFIIFSLWWSYITSIRFFQSKLKSSIKQNVKVSYGATTIMPCICLPCFKLNRLPIESYFKLIFSLIGIVIEVTFGFDLIVVNRNISSSLITSSTAHSEMIMNHHQDEHHHDAIRQALEMSSQDEHVVKFAKNSLQHSTMYFSFILGSIVEILISNRVDLPKGCDFIFGVIAFTIEALLFAFHLHGRSALDIHVHTLLVLAIFGCVVFTSLEYYNPKQIVHTYGRILFTLLQGIWFCQVGFVLYPPRFFNYYFVKFLNVNDDHDVIMVLTALFCWDIFLILIYLLALLWAVKKCFIDMDMFGKQWSELLAIDDSMNNNADGYHTKANCDSVDEKFITFLPLNNDEEDDEL